MGNQKFAVLSMDIEDWYHLDYFSGKQVDRSRSMLDGVINYIELLGKYNIKTTFFTLSELADSAKEIILYAAAQGHEIACHGKDHVRPVLKEVDVFQREIIEAKEMLSDLIGKDVIGYRAPCYSIDRERYDGVMAAGFKYSSSKIAFNQHPLYRELDLNDFDLVRPDVYKKNDFYEFELSTQRFLGKNIPVSGGGYIRILPWLFMKPLISSYLINSDIYVLYIHPFELSKMEMPKTPGVSFLTNVRARKGLGRVLNKVEQLIEMLTSHGFEIMPFDEIIACQDKERFVS